MCMYMDWYTAIVYKRGPNIHRWPVIGDFPAQMASNTENVSIWWRHHDVDALNSLLV